MDQEEVADISNSDNWPDFLNAAFYEMKRDFYLYLSYEEDVNQGIELSIGNNTFGSNSVTVEKLQTHYSGSCYKITPNFFTLKKTLEFTLIFDNDILKGDDIPWSINIYVTSKENAYGIIDSKWKNGEELILKPDTWLTVYKLNAIKYKYLAMSSNCSTNSYKTCLHRRAFYFWKVAFF